MPTRAARVLVLSLLLACSSSEPSEVPGNAGDGDTGDGDTGDGDTGDGDTGDGDTGDGDTGDGDGDGDGPNMGTCGDGVLTSDEACDDKNNDDGDGCSKDCQTVAAGVLCIPGQLCRPFARCGDSVVAFPEQCDDGDVDGGDGCSPTCKVEIGYKCSDKGGADSCETTECGDGTPEGTETCDDGNNDPLDGCAANCTPEPVCGNDGCTGKCGDGIRLGSSEECDDGNTLSGDGCSETCEEEPGYACDEDTGCEKGADGKCLVRVPAVYRDFDFEHPDFESGCSGSVETTGMVEAMLSNGKPVKTSVADGQCASDLNDWYQDTSDSTRFVSEIVLYDDGAGNFVNRYGDNGERWVTPMTYCITPDPMTMCTFDGNPLFFPVDGIPMAKDNGGVEALVYGTLYGVGEVEVSEAAATGAGPKHNFAFTSEITYWFEYKAGTDATLTFNGDDDVWVFVNGRRALDLGGLHPAVGDSFTINNTFAGNFGLEDGRVYEIKVFHAERHTKGSTFKLTLSGFAAARSNCVPDCGDGILGAGEECDNGDAENTGGYNGCTADCKLGPYCGDGEQQTPEETCDDGNRFDDDECPASCRVVKPL